MHVLRDCILCIKGMLISAHWFVGLKNVLENHKDFPVEVAVARAHALAHATAR